MAAVGGGANGVAAAAAPAAAVVPPSTAGKQLPLICRGHSRPVPHFSYSRLTDAGFFLASACKDGKAMLRVGETGDWVGTFIGHKGAVWSAHVDAPALRVATASADYTAKVWDAISGECTATFEHRRIVRTVEFSGDSRRLFTGGQERMLRVFDVERGDAPPLAQLADARSSLTIRQGVWRDENTVLWTSGDKSLAAWDVRQGEREAQRLELDGVCQSLELSSSSSSSSSSSVLAAAIGSSARFFDPMTLELRASIAADVPLNSVALHPTHTRMVCGGDDGWVRVHTFDLAASAIREIEVHKGHHGPVHCVHYAPDGETFASASEDGTIRLWQNTIKAYGLWRLPESTATATAAAVTTTTTTTATTTTTTSAGGGGGGTATTAATAADSSTTTAAQ